jgi:DNA-binding GntR family transcriptional regulator
VVDLASGGVLVRPSADLGEADPRPYVRLAARLRKEILNGALTPGHPVPSITTLSREFGHARMTCGKALQLLEQEQLLIRVPGLGYYVAGNLG